MDFGVLGSFELRSESLRQTNKTAERRGGLVSVPREDTEKGQGEEDERHHQEPPAAQPWARRLYKPELSVTVCSNLT